MLAQEREARLRRVNYSLSWVPAILQRAGLSSSRLEDCLRARTEGLTRAERISLFWEERRLWTTSSAKESRSIIR